jgi:hypothetical protein
MLLQRASSMILDQAAMWMSVLSVKALWITSGLLMKQISRERGWFLIMGAGICVIAYRS